jgi:CubicO group peptidase (beta-lactamase class C family)
MEDAMQSELKIEGTCEARFAPVRDRFAENFSTFGETGAALALTLEGRPVLDIWAGHADAERTRPWKPDTIANVFSTTKGMTALCAHRLADQGKLDLDAPVARYWPEFARGGKAQLPVRYLLSHQAGLAAVRKPLALEAFYDWETMTKALAEETPWWEPGTRHGYHALTYGWLVGEVIRRVSGRSVGTYFREEIAAPLGLDCHIGLGAEHDTRVAPLQVGAMTQPEDNAMLVQALADPDSLLAKVMLNPMLPPDAVNTRDWRAAEIPAANGHTNARALARLYGALACGGRVDGVQLLSKEAIDRAIAVQVDGPDAVLPLHTTIGLGFFLSSPTERLGPNPRSFGHGGMGGSMGFADPDTGLGFGYVMNEMHLGLWLIDPRVVALIDAVYSCL